MRRAFVLGGRSWIAYHLAKRFNVKDWQVLGSSSIQSDSSCLPDDMPLKLTCITKSTHLRDALEEFDPACVINLSAGIQESDYTNHGLCLEYCQKHDAHYVYTSSALALDGYKIESLVESLPAKSITPYGRFKTRCENLLESKANVRWLILRFSSIHGWSPWRHTRTEAFLDNLALGETVGVHKGVIQNRLSDSMLAEAIASLIEKSARGVAHIGAVDSSEEIDFLRRLAACYGYKEDQVKANGNRKVNLALISDLGKHPRGLLTEADTLREIALYPQLQKYRFELQGATKTEWGL